MSEYLLPPVDHDVRAITVALVDSTKSVLLVRHLDNDVWTLPGGPVQPDDPIDEIAKQKVLEMAGVDITEIPSAIIHDGTEGTADSLGHTSAWLTIVHNKPDVSGDILAEGRWFDLRAITDLERESRESIDASHIALIKMAATLLDDFEQKMDKAQDLHGKGKYADAQPLWHAASNMLVDPLEKGRALRGEAASLARRGNDEDALQKAQEALTWHTDAEDIFPGASEKMQRHLAESHAVVGRIILAPIIQAENAVMLDVSLAKQGAILALGHLEHAYAIISELEVSTGELDQHKINMLSRLAIGLALYGDRASGKEYAWDALKLAWKSESSKNSTSANISPGYARRAKLRAFSRAGAALAVTCLATSNSSISRGIALSIASSKAGL